MYVESTTGVQAAAAASRTEPTTACVVPLHGGDDGVRIQWADPEGGAQPTFTPAARAVVAALACPTIKHVHCHTSHIGEGLPHVAQEVIALTKEGGVLQHRAPGWQLTITGFHGTIAAADTPGSVSDTFLAHGCPVGNDGGHSKCCTGTGLVALARLEYDGRDLRVVQQCDIGGRSAYHRRA